MKKWGDKDSLIEFIWEGYNPKEDLFLIISEDKKCFLCDEYEPMHCFKNLSYLKEQTLDDTKGRICYLDEVERWRLLKEEELTKEKLHELVNLSNNLDTLYQVRRLIKEGYELKISNNDVFSDDAMITGDLKKSFLEFVEGKIKKTEDYLESI